MTLIWGTLLAHSWELNSCYTTWVNVDLGTTAIGWFHAHQISRSEALLSNVVHRHVQGDIYNLKKNELFLLIPVLNNNQRYLLQREYCEQTLVGLMKFGLNALFFRIIFMLRAFTQNFNIFHFKTFQDLNIKRQLMNTE